MKEDVFSLMSIVNQSCQSANVNQSACQSVNFSHQVISQLSTDLLRIWAAEMASLVAIIGAPRWALQIFGVKKYSPKIQMVILHYAIRQNGFMAFKLL